MLRRFICFLTLAMLAAVPASADPGDNEPARIEAKFEPADLDEALSGRDPAGVLEPFWQRDSQAFSHVRYHQVVEGVRVLDASASQHVAKRDPSLRISHADLVPEGVSVHGDFLLGDAAAAIARDAADVRVLLDGTEADVEPVWFHDGASLRAAYAVTMAALDPAGTWRVVVAGDDGEALEVQALSAPTLDRHAAAAATPLHDAPTHAPHGRAAYDATVHRVNPIVALQDPDRRDNPLSLDDGSFEDSYSQMTLEVHEAMPLMTDRVHVLDALTVPAGGRGLDFRRDDPRFLDVMLLGHVEAALDILAENGYGDLLAYDQVRGVARVPSPSPNAFATEINGQGYIVFFYRAPGSSLTGGFSSSAEDAEVVVHELGHIFHFNAAPGVGGEWRGAWAEGTADFFASLLLEGDRFSQGFGDPCMGEWITSYFGDGMPSYEGLPCIRVLDNNLTYPEDATQSGHWNGQFWSGPIWEVRQTLTQNESLELFMEALFLTPGNIEGPGDLADTLLLADCGLTGCQMENAIRSSFGAKNITVSPVPEEFRVDDAQPEVLDAEPDEESPGVAAAALFAVLVALALLRQRRS